jgi:hypothetical protein
MQNKEKIVYIVSENLQEWKPKAYYPTVTKYKEKQSFNTRGLKYLEKGKSVKRAYRGIATFSRQNIITVLKIYG